MALLNIMKNVLKTEPSYRQVMEEFICLKEEIIVLTPSIKVNLSEKGRDCICSLNRWFQVSS